MKIIETERAPMPRGHYSQAIVHQGVVYVAGQLPIDPADPSRPPGDIRAQTGQVLDNLSAILQAAGSDLGSLLQVTIYVTDLDLWGEVNAVYAARLGSHRPARAVVPVSTLHRGFQVEIQAIAAVLSE
ncbi:MAG: RidA family protein [Gemmatimonadales bacterium]